MRGPAIVAMLLALAASAAAGDLDSLEVRTSERGRYEVRGHFIVEAPMAVVYGIITDYDRLDRLDDTIVESVLLEQRGGTAVVRTLVRACLVFFCRQLERVEQVEERPPNEITATLVPERSDLDFQITRWRLEPDDARTRVNFGLDVVPGFFVPGWAAKRQLAASLNRTASAVQALALELRVAEIAGE